MWLDLTATDPLNLEDLLLAERSHVAEQLSSDWVECLADLPKLTRHDSSGFYRSEIPEFTTWYE